jgi:hypothetical protein
MHALPRLSLALAAITSASMTLWAVPPSVSSGPAATPASAAPAASPSFPASWIGHWKGEATTEGGGQTMRFTQELIVAPTDRPDRFGWTIVYAGESGRQERTYELIVRNAERGEYAIDEKNGIILDARYLAGGLHSHFSVEGTRITTRERLEGFGTPDEAITVEMIVLIENAVTVTGGKSEVAGVAIPEVRSWMPRSVQRATLRRR